MVRRRGEETQQGEGGRYTELEGPGGTGHVGCGGLAKVYLICSREGGCGAVCYDVREEERADAPKEEGGRRGERGGERGAATCALPRGRWLDLSRVEGGDGGGGSSAGGGEEGGGGESEERVASGGGGGESKGGAGAHAQHGAHVQHHGAGAHVQELLRGAFGRWLLGELVGDGGGVGGEGEEGGGGVGEEGGAGGVLGYRQTRMYVCGDRGGAQGLMSEVVSMLVRHGVCGSRKLAALTVKRWLHQVRREGRGEGESVSVCLCVYVCM